jgi:putative ABC transport system permease protein
VMTFFIKLMLIAIVLISILNVMIMAVYERVREIGTIAAIGTLPRKILSLFLVEGFCLGLTGALVGVFFGLVIIFALNLSKITFNFGQATGLILAPAIAPIEVVTASLLVIIVSVLASLQPAYKASRMEPIDALRHL